MPNRLADSLSPYLEQHAGNPVDWYPWGPEALSTARTSDRPLLLSVGYSACHWCHVMAEESFADESIAERMNAWFVNIKVDREERPDIDRVYQLAHQLLTGRGGGWPLTVFVDPGDLVPFAAGTYFPPEPRHGLIGFGELLERVHAAWLNQRETLKAQNEQLDQALKMISARTTEPTGAGGDPRDALLGQLEARRDRRHGGFGDAPKFPQAPLLGWLLGVARGDEGAAGMLGDALDAMARNGLFDHLGGGFFRYCVDSAWEIPHFEKMLYDNALLLPLFAEASVRWNNAGWAATARRTAAFLLGELRLDGGGFASSLDADSAPPEPQPGDSDTPCEGAFYLWTPARFDACLDPEEAALAKARFGLDGPANFEGERWHPVIARSVAELTDRAGDADELRARLKRIRERVAACRADRLRPARDDKMVASWNALTAAGLLRAGRLLGQPEWIEAGCETLDRIGERLLDAQPPHSVWRNGRSAQVALADDLAGVLLAITERLAARWDRTWLTRAMALAEDLRTRFFDPDGPTLYLTPTHHEPLPMRPSAYLDESTPSGAALAVQALGRLGHLTADPGLLELAAGIVAGARGDMERMPAAHAALLQAAREFEDPVPQVLIGGPDGDADDWHAELSARPDLWVYRVAAGDDDAPGALAELAKAASPRAVVCLGSRCLAPAGSRAQLERRLAEARDHRQGAS